MSEAWIAMVYICSPVFIHCDDGNAYDRMQFSTLYPNQSECAKAARAQLEAIPPIPGNATMTCELRP